MIGNKIQFLHYEFGNASDYERNRTAEQRRKVGLVVDAFTDIRGNVRGSSETIFGFGSGSTYGNTESKRKYKIEYYESYSENPRYINIYDWQLERIISLAWQVNQEVNEEKFRDVK